MSVPDDLAAGPSSQDEAVENAGAEKTADLIDPVYHERIWKHMVRLDIERPLITLQSTQLDYRAILVKQIQDTAKKLCMSIATCHSAVALLDIFMDGHLVTPNRLHYVALACLSLAGKSEEKYSYALSLKVLSNISNLHICGKPFRRLEWLVGTYVDWKLMIPTAATFAYLLLQFLVTEKDVKNRPLEYASKLREVAGRLLDAYLDLTLCDIHLKLLNAVYVGCACVASTRADLYLYSWPPALEAYTGKSYSSIHTISRRLQRMMVMVKSRQKGLNFDAVHGYRSIPQILPAKNQPEPATRDSSGNFTSFSYVTVQANICELEREKMKASTANPPQPVVELPYVECSFLDMTVFDRSNDPTDPTYYASTTLVAPSPQPEASTSAGVKRGSVQTNVEIENKKMRNV